MIEYRTGGRTRRLAIGKHGSITPEEARKEVMKRLGEVTKGTDPSETRNKRLRAPTVATLCERFMNEHAHVHCKPNTARNYGLLFNNHIKLELGMFKIEDIRRSDIAEFHHSMKDTPYQANRA